MAEPAPASHVALVQTRELSRARLAELREMVQGAFGPRLDADDWRHALGGVHVVVWLDRAPVAHAAVVPRILEQGERRYRTGYVEAVAVAAEHRGQGHAAAVMAAVGRLIEGEYELGALSARAGVAGLYRSRGWRPWQGQTFVREPDGAVVRTADDDDGVHVLPVPGSTIDLTGDLVCDWRQGDVW